MKNFRFFAALIICTLTIGFFSSTAFASSPDLSSDADIDYEQAYNQLAEQLYHTPDFIYDDNGILSANEMFIIKCFEHSFQSAFNKETGRYEVNLAYSYKLFYDVPSGEIPDTLHSFTWNGQEFNFCINTVNYCEGAYVDKDLLDSLPEDFKKLLNNFHHPIVLGFYTAQDNTMGMTNSSQKLVTTSGVHDRFIYVRINKYFTNDGYNMADTIIHELGHAIVNDIELDQNLDWLSTCFIHNNNFIIANLINEIVNDNSEGDRNYGYIYQSISDYAASNLGEIPSEAFAQVYLAPENSSDFNKVFVGKMLNLWEVEK